MSGMRAALRIARREALRARGRSALVVAMIGLPMAGLAFADVAVRTGQVPTAEKVRREIGAADLLAEAVAGAPIEQKDMWGYEFPDSLPAVPPKEGADPASVLPPGTTVSPRFSSSGVRVRAGERLAVAEVDRIDLNDPMSEGLVRLRSGAFPRTPGEAAVTTPLASELGAGIGDAVTVEGTSFRVSGIVRMPVSTSSRQVFVLPGAPLPARAGMGGDAMRRWGVDLPPGVRDLDVLPALNKAGFRVQPRTWYFDPPPNPYPGGGELDAESVGVTLVVVGLATLEIVLLAGTAFAVGARRKRRELALVAATGGDRRDVRRIVLAEGLVLGAVAGASGVALGAAGVFLGRPLLDRATGQMLGPLDLRPLELGAIVAIGAGTALLATLLPARAASRQPVVAALTGRRGEVRTRKRVPVLALVAVVAGAALAFWAAGEDVVRDPDNPSLLLDRGRQANFSLVLAGAVLAELGFVACAPALVGLVGRTASRLPLALRLAARDAARHRTRSGPAVAAVVAAVAGSVALSVYLASDTERQRRDYTPSQPPGSVAIGHGDERNRVAAADIAAAAAFLPVRDRIEVGEVADWTCDGTRECAFWQAETPERYRCDQYVASSPACANPRFGPRPGSLAVADARYVSLWNDRDDPAVARALASGKAVVFDERWLRDGRLTLVGEFHRGGGGPLRAERRTLDAVVAARPSGDYYLPVAVLSPETVRRLGLPAMTSRTFFRTTRQPTGAEEAKARGALTRNNPWTDLYVERGFQPRNGLALLALLGGAALVTLGSTGIATGLAAADSRPDLATLAAVGAAPRVRRRLAMAQAATVAALGSALGILAGLVPSIAVVGARDQFPLAVPWTSFVAIGLGVPLLAALLVGAVTRSRLPLERRIA